MDFVSFDIDLINSLLLKHEKTSVDDGVKKDCRVLIDALSDRKGWGSLNEDETTISHIKNNIPKNQYNTLSRLLKNSVDILEDPESDFTMRSYFALCALVLEIKDDC